MKEEEIRYDLIAHIREQLHKDPEGYCNEAKLKVVAGKLSKTLLIDQEEAEGMINVALGPCCVCDGRSFNNPCPACLRTNPKGIDRLSVLEYEDQDADQDR